MRKQVNIESGTRHYHYAKFLRAKAFFLASALHLRWSRQAVLKDRICNGHYKKTPVVVVGSVGQSMSMVVEQDTSLI